MRATSPTPTRIISTIICALWIAWVASGFSSRHRRRMSAGPRSSTAYSGRAGRGEASLHNPGPSLADRVELDAAQDPFAFEAVKQLVARYGSPLLIIDAERVRRQYRLLAA